jgi:hypothetical protein
MGASLDMSKDTKHIEILKQKRNVLLAILMLPVVGMAISILLIGWRLPNRIGTAIPIIFIIMLQYVLLVLWIKNKIDVLEAR